MSNHDSRAEEAGKKVESAASDNPKKIQHKKGGNRVSKFLHESEDPHKDILPLTPQSERLVKILRRLIQKKRTAGRKSTLRGSGEKKGITNSRCQTVWREQGPRGTTV